MFGATPSIGLRVSAGVDGERLWRWVVDGQVMALLIVAQLCAVAALVLMFRLRGRRRGKGLRRRRGDVAVLTLMLAVVGGIILLIAVTRLALAVLM